MRHKTSLCWLHDEIQHNTWASRLVFGCLKCAACILVGGQQLFKTHHQQQHDHVHCKFVLLEIPCSFHILQINVTVSVFIFLLFSNSLGNSSILKIVIFIFQNEKKINNYATIQVNKICGINIIWNYIQWFRFSSEKR